MRGSTLLVLVLGVLGTNAAFACPACGDKLNFGGNMAFERKARAVGHVALLSSLGPAAAEISSLLEKDGHHVEVAVDAAALQHGDKDHQHSDKDHQHGDKDHQHGDKDHQHGDKGHPVDVVIAHWPQAADVARLFDAVEGGPTVLAVAYDANDAAAWKAAGPTTCFARVDGRHGRKFTEAVTKVIEQRAKGTPPTCAITVARQSE
jgi:hypothetical protein